MRATPAAREGDYLLEEAGGAHEERTACHDFPRQALPARRLAMKHPVTGGPMEFVAPVPADIASLLETAGLRLPGAR